MTYDSEENLAQDFATSSSALTTTKIMKTIVSQMPVLSVFVKIFHHIHLSIIQLLLHKLIMIMIIPHL